MCHLILDFGELEREKAFTRIAQSLDKYIETYSPDGGCDEGPMYWGAAGGSFGACLALLRDASRGEIDIFDNEKIKQMGAYFYKVFIDNEYFVNFADGDPIVPVFPTVFYFGKNIGDDMLMRLGAMTQPWPIKFKYWFFPYDHLLDMFMAEERASYKDNPPYVKDAWLDHIHVMTAREFEGTTEGLFLSAKAGSNVESHNHNDVGSFVVYLDGKPLFIDIGTEEYKAQTFSPQRFELWFLQSQYHNCPTIGGVMQHDGKDYYSTDVSYNCGETSIIKMDIKNAYEKRAGIVRWNRSVALVRSVDNYADTHVLIEDDFQLENRQPVVYNFMTHKKPKYNTYRIEIDLDGKIGVLEFDNNALDVVIEEIPLTDVRTSRNWGDLIYRILLSEKHDTAAEKRVFKIFGEVR
jgi:hypothetical protein